MRSQYTTLAQYSALAQQPPELESSEGETAGMLPPASRPPGACRQRSQQRHRKDESGVSRRKTLSRSLISDRINQRCLSTATRAAIDRPVARAVSLVAQRDKSAVLRSSQISSALNPSPSSKSLSRSAWYACKTAMVCRHEPA